MNAIDAFIRDKLQRAALYGLDHYSIPVAFWAYAFININICSYIGRILTVQLYKDTPTQIMISCTVCALIYWLFGTSTNQLLEHEQKGKYELYEKLRAKFEDDSFFRYLVIVFTLVLMPLHIYSYIKNNEMSTRYFVLLLIDNFTFFFFVFARCLHTRRREPPMGQVSFSPT